MSATMIAMKQHDAQWKVVDVVSEMLRFSGLLAGLISCGTALVLGIAAGWPSTQIVTHLLLSLLFLVLTQVYRFAVAPARWLLRNTWVYLLLVGTICLALQVVSEDPYLQPMAFTVPLIYAALRYGSRRALAVAALYLGLLALGLWLGNVQLPQGLVLPVIGYGVLMFFMVAVVRLSVEQAAARGQADLLAADLARERDALSLLVAENARLTDEARQGATLAERNRLARELHDTIAQGLTAVTMQLDAAQRSFERDPPRSRARLARAHELARATLEDVRASVWTLAAPLADGAAIEAALAELTERFAQRTGLRASYRHCGQPPALGHGAATQVLRIVQEALQNVEKHAEASTVEVGSLCDDGGLRVWVRDDGRGFDLATAPGSAAGGFGLFSLHERARLAGGTMTVTSTPGAGTTVGVQIAEQP